MDKTPWVGLSVQAEMIRWANHPELFEPDEYEDIVPSKRWDPIEEDEPDTHELIGSRKTPYGGSV